MKLILCCCIIMLCTSCSSTFSPVGQWDLYAQQNNILERLTPHVQMNIYENGEFVCTAIEKNDTTKNNGKWKQIGDNLFFEDATGTGNFSAFMPSMDKIVLKDTTFSSNSNIINIDILGGIINQVNPVAFQINSINSKYCKIYITSAKIQGNIIKTEGIFIINKNYER